LGFWWPQSGVLGGLEVALEVEIGVLRVTVGVLGYQGVALEVEIGVLGVLVGVLVATIRGFGGSRGGFGG